MKNKACTCRPMPAKPTSQDYNLRYMSILKCPVHSKVPDHETRRYELPKLEKPVVIKKQKGMVYIQCFAVMQSVGLKDFGVKGYDSESGWRAVSTFPTREDARAYLLDVLDTVKREQKMGVRSKRNLDPEFEGGLDFYISKALICLPEEPMKKRGWPVDEIKL